MLLSEAAEEAVGLPVGTRIGVGYAEGQFLQDGVELCGGGGLAITAKSVALVFESTQRLILRAAFVAFRAATATPSAQLAEP